MKYSQKFAIIGFIIGIFPIILGIVALTTPVWININHNQTSNVTTSSYNLFRIYKINEQTRDEDIHSFETSQYFEIGGYAVLIFGLLAGVISTALIDKRKIHFVAPIILIIGTVTILLGFIFYIISVVEHVSSSTNTTLHLGYSMILMIITCIIGCILTAYFSFSAGYIHRHILSTVNIY